MTNQRVIGVIENMAYFVCPDCGSRHEIFGRGGGSEIARRMETQLLGQIPLDERAREAGDHGTPIALDPSSATGRAFADLAAAVVGALATPSAPDDVDSAA